MTKTMPQEIEVWYLIPAIRKEIARIFVKEHNLSQKETSNILGVTEAAISQYLKSKRASKLKFSKKEIYQIKKTAEKIMKDKDNVVDYVYKLCNDFRNSGIMCRIHMKHDKSITKGCKACMEN